MSNSLKKLEAENLQSCDVEGVELFLKIVKSKTFYAKAEQRDIHASKRFESTKSETPFMPRNKSNKALTRSTETASSDDRYRMQ